MKHFLLTTIAAVVLVGCGESASERALHKAASDGNIEAVKQHLASGTDVNAKGGRGLTPLHFSAGFYSGLRGRGGVGKEMVELLIANGADVNAKDGRDYTPLDWAMSYPEIAELLRKLGGKTGEELKAAGN